MLGRPVGSSLLRLPRASRLPRYSAPTNARYDLIDALRAVSIGASISRSYATETVTTSRPGRPKKAVGEPSRPVKRAVKQAAKSPKEDAATKKVKARKETAAKKANPAKAAARKPYPRKPDDDLTPKQLQARQVRDARKANSGITALKKAALKPPKPSLYTAWTVFMGETAAKVVPKGASLETARSALADSARSAKERYSNLTPAEREHYNHLAHTKTEEARAVYKQWVESHSPEAIRAANKARMALRKDAKKEGSKTISRAFPPIKDERSVKQTMNPFATFSANRWASGDLKDIKLGESMKLIAQEWKALNESEKQKYKTLFEKDRERYQEEYTSVYGHAPPSSRASSVASA